MDLWNRVEGAENASSCRTQKRIVARSERLEARVSPETKPLSQKATEIQDATLTDFVVNSVIEAAKHAVREHEFAELTRRDRIAYFERYSTRQPRTPGCKKPSRGTHRYFGVKPIPIPPFRDIEPLGEKHKALRATFSCGVEPLARYLLF